MMFVKREVIDKYSLFIGSAITIRIFQNRDRALIGDVDFPGRRVNRYTQREVIACGKCPPRIGTTILIFILQDINISILRGDVQAPLAVESESGWAIEISKFDERKARRHLGTFQFDGGGGDGRGRRNCLCRRFCSGSLWEVGFCGGG